MRIDAFGCIPHFVRNESGVRPPHSKNGSRAAYRFSFAPASRFSGFCEICVICGLSSVLSVASVASFRLYGFFAAFVFRGFQPILLKSAPWRQ